ncbi:hypothetical protein Ahia01_001191600 [Argonauta hians]
MNERNLHHHRQLHEWYELHKFNQLNNNNNNNNNNSNTSNSVGNNMCLSASLMPYLSPQKALWIENWRQEVNKAFFKIPDAQTQSAANKGSNSGSSSNNPQTNRNNNNNNNTSSSNNNNNNNNKNNSNSNNDSSVLANGVVSSSKLKNGILPKNGIKLNQSLNGHLSRQHHTPAKSAEWKEGSRTPLKLQSKVLSCSFSDLNLQPGFSLEKKSSKKRNGKLGPIDHSLLKLSDTARTSAKSVSSRDCQNARSNDVQVGVSPPSDESGELLQSKPKEGGSTTLALRSSSNSLLNVISVDDCRATVHYQQRSQKSKSGTTEGYHPLEQKNSPQSTTKTQKRLLKRLQAKYLGQNGTDPAALCASNHSSIASEHVEDSLCRGATTSKDLNAITQDAIHKDASRTTKSNSFTASSDSPVFKRLNSNLRKHMKTLLQSQKNAVKSRLRSSDHRRQSSSPGCCLRVCELQGDCNPSDEHLHSS